MRNLAAIPFLLIVIGMGLSYLRIIPGLAGLGLCGLGVAIGLGVAFKIFFAGLRSGPAYFWVFALLAALPAILALPMVVKALSYPSINDVSTDLETPPTFVAALQAPANLDRDLSFPARFGPIVKESYPDVRPLVLEETPEAAFQRVEELVKLQSGWVITHRDAETRTLEGEVTSSVFGFVDDFVIRVSDQAGKARVDMRSKSREGRSDLGANAERIQNFFAELSK